MAAEKKSPYVEYCAPKEAKNFAAVADICPTACSDSIQACLGVADNKETGSNEWSNELLKCHEDLPLCGCTFCCPCVVAARNWEAVDNYDAKKPCEGWCCSLFVVGFCGCGQCLVAAKRTQMRKKYNIKGTRTIDCFVGCICFACALCQEARELKIKDPKYKGPDGTQGAGPAKQQMS